MGAWCNVELRGHVCNAAAERDARIARLREENEQADRLVSEYRERQTEAERKCDEAQAEIERLIAANQDLANAGNEARALLRRIAALPDYGDMGGETEEWWDELQQICRAAKVMLAGDRQGDT